MVLLRLGVAGEDQFASIGGRKMYVQHLNGGKLLEHGARCQARSQYSQTSSQVYVQAISQERHKEVRLDAILSLVKNGAQAQVVFQVLEGSLDLRELNVKLPQMGRIAPSEIAAQQIASFPA